MQIIKISVLDNGAHLNQSWPAGTLPPDGYAVIPNDMPIPDTFPFVNIEVENGIVTSMTAGTVPEPEPELEPEPAVTLEELEEENKHLKAQLQAQSERSDFIEDCIAELACVAYSSGTM